MNYITKYRIQSRRGPGIGWPMGYINAGKIFDSNNQENGWVEYSRAHWIPASACELYNDVIIPPDDPINASLWWTICKSKPFGYKPAGLNIGSFAIGWLMPEEPEGFVNKPAGFKLEPDHIQYLKYLNPQNPGAVKWLVDQEGTSKVLSLYDNGQYRCPVPCYSEANQVNVLEWGEIAVRIETVSIYDPLPETLPPYLLHKWYGYTKPGGSFFQVQAEQGGVNYPLFARSDSAWIQRSGIQLNSPL